MTSVCVAERVVGGAPGAARVPARRPCPDVAGPGLGERVARDLSGARQHVRRPPRARSTARVRAAGRRARALPLAGRLGRRRADHLCRRSSSRSGSSCSPSWPTPGPWRSGSPTTASRRPFWVYILIAFEWQSRAGLGAPAPRRSRARFPVGRRHDLPRLRWRLLAVGWLGTLLLILPAVVAFLLVKEGPFGSPHVPKDALHAHRGQPDRRGLLQPRGCHPRPCCFVGGALAVLLSVAKGCDLVATGSYPACRPAHPPQAGFL